MHALKEISKEEKNLFSINKKINRKGLFKLNREKLANAKLDRETNPNLTAQDAEDLSAILDSDYINLAAVAHDVYPDHTEEGAQSQLRKKVKGLTNDNGSKYKIKKKSSVIKKRIGIT